MHKDSKKYNMVRAKSGFSLIELLVVVAIIGILAAVGLTGYQAYINQSRDATAQADFEQLQRIVKTDMMAISNSISARSDMAQSMTEPPRCETWRDTIMTEINSSKQNPFGGTFLVDGNNCGTLDNQSRCTSGGAREWRRGQFLLSCANECARTDETAFRLMVCLCRDEATCETTASTNMNVCVTPPNGAVC